MLNVDNLQLLKGKPITIGEDFCLVYPITLEEIADMGANKFFRFLNLLTFTQQDVDESLKEIGIETNEKISPYQFILMSSESKDFSLEIKQAFYTFIREEIEILPESVVVGDRSNPRYFDEELFSQLQKVLILQNNLDKGEDSRMNNPSDAHAAKIIEKIKNAQKRKSAKNSDETVEFADLVSCLAAKGNGINIFNIWNLNYYSFNDQFQRVKIIEEYEMNIRSILAGADPKKIELKHWIRSIKQK